MALCRGIRLKQGLNGKRRGREIGTKVLATSHLLIARVAGYATRAFLKHLVRSLLRRASRRSLLPLWATRSLDEVM
jgi:hypothetical protein